MFYFYFSFSLLFYFYFYLIFSFSSALGFIPSSTSIRPNSELSENPLGVDYRSEFAYLLYIYLYMHFLLLYYFFHSLIFIYLYLSLTHTLSKWNLNLIHADTSWIPIFLFASHTAHSGTLSLPCTSFLFLFFLFHHRCCCSFFLLFFFHRYPITLYALHS